MPLSGEQIKAARDLLRWKQRALADTAGVSIETVKRLEAIRGDITDAHPSTIEAIEAAFNDHIEFISENGGGPGVRLK